MFLIALSGNSVASVNQDVGYSQLVNELGAGVPTGIGVKVFQVEAAVSDAWLPDPSRSQFAGKSIVDLSSIPSAGNSNHASSVGIRYYGVGTSYSPDVTDIGVHDVNSWFFEFFDVDSSAGFYPALTDRQIVNHSWVGTGFVDESGDFSPGANSAVLRLSDWFSATDEIIQVFGSTNNDDYPVDNSQVLMATSFNGITAGVSDHSHGYNVVPLDSLYQAGRAAIHLVVPVSGTSFATPDISSAAAMLIDAAKQNPAWSESSTQNRNGNTILNAERSEVIKALLLAGASRETNNTTNIGDIVDYRQSAGDRTDNGLDWRYGAGQLNVYNSYQILASGEMASLEDGGAANNGYSGFDHDPAFGGASGSNTVATYDLGVASGTFQLMASLVWNLDVVGAPNGNTAFDTSAALHNLDLELVEVGQGAVMSSASNIDNTENIWAVIEQGKRYQLRVISASGQAPFLWDYAIAWRQGVSIEQVRVPILSIGHMALLLALFGLVATAAFRRKPNR